MSLASRLMPRGYGARPTASIRTTVPWSGANPGPCVAASIAALAAPVASAQSPSGALDFRRVLDLSRGSYIEGSVAFLRVRDAAGRIVLDERWARPLARQAPAPGGPLPPDELRAALQRQLLAARPADRPLLAPDHDHRHGRTGVRATVRPGAAAACA